MSEPTGKWYYEIAVGYQSLNYDEYHVLSEIWFTIVWIREGDTMRGVNIDFKDLVDAYTIYREITRSPANGNTMTRFYKFLGIPAGPHQRIPEDKQAQVKSKLDWLCSPHAKALYKAWRIQHPEGA